MKEIVEIKGDVKTILEKMERLEGKFASKRVEWVVKGLIGLVLMTVLGALLSKVIV